MRKKFVAARTLSITRVGKVYLLLTLGIGVGALNTGNNLLYLVLGVLLATVIVSGILSEQSLRYLTVERMGPFEAYADASFGFTWSLLNRGRSAFSLSLIEIDAPVSGQAEVFYLPVSTMVTVRAPMVVPNRGIITLKKIWVTTSYPFGFFKKGRYFVFENRLTVFPRRIKAGRKATPAILARRDGALDSALEGGDGDVSSLSRLELGEDARRIHWVKTASAGHLLQVQRQDQTAESYLIRVPLLKGPALEEACEQAAWWTEELIGKGHAVGLQLNEETISPGSNSVQYLRILRALANFGRPS